MRTVLTLPKAGDINAGLLVALVGIPQCLAYAMLSGLPPMYGLVTAAIPGMIAAVLGKSAGVTVGPTNTTGLIILASLTPWANEPELLLTAMATLAFLAGVARLMIVVLKAERIFDFVPEAVMIGFATGAAIIIALMQLDELLGPPFQSVRNVVDELRLLASFDPQSFSLSSFVLGLIALVAVILGKKFLPKWPIALLVLVASIVIVWLDALPFSKDWMTLSDTTDVPIGWPTINTSLPSWSMIQALIFPGFAVAFIGSLELIVTLRNRHEQRALRAELGSQGVANMVGSFTGAFPASTSLTRSVLLDMGGSQSRWAPFIAAAALIPIILFGAEGIRNIPQPVIAGLLIATALSMLKPKAIKQMLMVNNQTRALFLITVSSTLILNFHEAILLGAALGIVMFLFQTSQPHLVCSGLNDNGDIVDESAQTSSSELIQISGSLYFAAARQLPDRLTGLLRPDCKLLYLDLTHAHQARVAAIQALLQFTEECSLREIKVEITGASEELKSLAYNMGVRLPWSSQTLRVQLTRS